MNLFLASAAWFFTTAFALAMYLAWLHQPFL